MSVTPIATRYQPLRATPVTVGAAIVLVVVLLLEGAPARPPATLPVQTAAGVPPDSSLVVLVDSSGALWLDTLRVAPHSLVEKMERLGSASRPLRLLVDPAASVDEVTSVLRALREAGIERCVIEPRHGSR